MRRVVAAVHGAVDPQALAREGVDPDRVVDFSSNSTPLGHSASVPEAALAVVFDAYPEPRAFTFREAVAARHGLPVGCTVAGNGSTELIRLLAQLTLEPGATALSLAPSFGEYKVATELCGARFVEVGLTSLGRGAGFAYEPEAVGAAIERTKPSLCWICSPNNPTGTQAPGWMIEQLVDRYPQTMFVLDEAYCDLLAQSQWSLELLSAGNLVVLRSMTKAWGLAGLRLGYALAEERTAAALLAAAPPWNVNACAQAAGLAGLQDEEHYRRGITCMRDQRDRLASALRADGWVIEPSQAGFFLVRVPDAAAVRKRLLSDGCLVRDCTSFGLPDCIRISPRGTTENDRLLAAVTALPRS